ncbi:uracil-DNA glycosylase [Candidatus Microgenomates bacterium]|nr:uracil-DNA glycosylase [Candidatus Microgenomates bacterium]
MSKIEELAKLKDKVDKDMTLPLRQGATQLVFGEGNPDTQVYFLGEAPGYWEDQKGRPFVGQAGKLLDKLIEDLGMKREDVYISNVVRFRPPENRDPLPAELEAFAPYVDREIEIIDPKVIVTLGRYSMAKFLPDVKISQVHGKPRRVRRNGKDITVVPMYHPAAALRSGEVLNALREDFKAIAKVLEEDESNEDLPAQAGMSDESKKEEIRAEQMTLV